jgi:hypothetical protein
MPIAWLVQSMAYTPPPALLKPSPYVFAPFAWIPHPSLSFCPGALTAQFDDFTVPLKLPPLSILQPGAVCRVIVLKLLELTPSIASISPLAGQSSRLAVQNAGHVPHTLPGMCARSRIIKPLLYVFLDSNRMLGRPPDVTTFVESTPNLTD